MRMVIELFKVVLLTCMVLLMAIIVGILPNPTAVKNHSDNQAVEPDTVSVLQEDVSQRESDLRKIMEHSLSHIFKFPESVKFQNSNYEYKRVFHNYGIKVAPEKELEYATLCGQYAASNAMGVYGELRPFYAEVAVNNEQKGITGEVWLDIGGEIKTLMTLDSSITVSGEQEEFEKLYSKNCANKDKEYMGAFSEYEDGYKAFSVKYYIDNLEQIKSHSGANESLISCTNTGATLDYCIGSEMCEIEKETSEYCTFKKQVCLANDTDIICEEKLKLAYKNKKPSN